VVMVAILAVVSIFYIRETIRLTNEELR